MREVLPKGSLLPNVNQEVRGWLSYVAACTRCAVLDALQMWLRVSLLLFAAAGSSNAL
jgi:hypothetical protein